MEVRNTFFKNSVYFKIIWGCPSYEAYHFLAFCTFWGFFDILKRRYNDILWQAGISYNRVTGPLETLCHYHINGAQKVIRQLGLTTGYCEI